MRIVTHSERDLTSLRVAAIFLLVILWLGYEAYKFLEPYGWTAVIALVCGVIALLAYAHFSEERRMRKLRRGD